MKIKQKHLALKKIQIAKINSFQIIGGDLEPNSSVECLVYKSRTPSGNQTQTYTNPMDCYTTTGV